MKRFILLFLASCFLMELSAQCGFSGFLESGTLFTPQCGNLSVNVGTNSQIRMNVSAGVWYDFNTCSSGYDTQLTGYTTGAGLQFYNDDNGPACGGTRASVYWQAGYNGELRVQNNQFNCVTTPGSGGSATLTYRKLPPVLGSPSTTQVNFCNSGGNFGTAVTANGTQYGTVEWNFGNNSGGWSGVWVTGTSSGICCFPKKTSNSDGNADRLRYRVNNGGCVTGYSPTILIVNRWNENPTSLSISNANYCTTTVPGTITLTANFPTAVNMNGTVGFYSGSCGGTLVATVNPGANSSTVSAVISAPTSSTTYYARYQPGTGTSCGNSPCVSGTVTVVPPPNPGNYAYNTLYTCSTSGSTYNSSGNIVTNSVSSTSGSIFWQYGRPDGVWINWGGGTTAPGNCCFPLNPASNQPDRLRSYATNSGCTVFGATVQVVSDNMSAPTGASSSATSICEGSPATITLSYSGGATGVLGEARWYANSCGGTLVGSGNNLSISSPSVSTTYYVRFENPCTQTSCANVTVSVTDINLSTEVYNLSCYQSGDGAIDLTVTQRPPSFGNSLEQWVSASQGVVTDVNNDVVRWQDLSGNNNHYITNAGSGVKIQANSINGEPAVRFNNSAIMESPNFVSNPYTMFVVGKMNGGTSRRLVSSGSTNWLFGWWGGNRDAMYADGWVSVPGGTAGSITTPYLYSVSGTGGLSSFYRNGTLLYANANGVSAPGIISLGGWGTGNTEQSDGDVCEILVYNKVLTNAEHQEIENYLNLKYAVSVGSGTESYVWSPGGATTEDLSALDAGTYSVTVTKNGCAKTLAGIVVNERQEIAISGSVTNEVCPTDNNGAINTSVTSDASATPPAFNDLLIWTKADEGVIKDLSGDVVTWKDLSGNDNHFEVVFGNDVQEVAAQIGGEAVIRFNGNNIMAGPQVINTNFTIMVVGKMNAGINQRLVSSNTRNWLLGWHNGQRQKFFSEGWVYNPAVGSDMTTPYIYTGTGNVGTDSYALYENGVLLASNNLGSQPPGALSLGGWGQSNGERSTGDVAEVIAYNRVLTTDERLALERYLANKYGIAAGAGVGLSYSWSPGGSTANNITGLDAGSYTLTSTDVAGCTNVETFIVGTDKTESVEATTANASPNPICTGSSTTLSISGGTAGTGAVWRWYSGTCGGTLVGTGPSISVSPTVSTDYYVRAEGDCNATACKMISVEVFSASTNAFLVSGTTTTAIEGCVEGLWTYYANPAKPDEYIFGIRKNTNVFTANVTINDLPGSATYSSTGGAGPDRGTWLLGRYWNVEITSGSVTAPVDIRFFVDPAEITQAQNEANAFLNSTIFATNITPLSFFKTTGTNFDPATAMVGGDFTFTPTYLTYSVNAVGGVAYIEMTGITSFSGGTGGFSVNDDGATLPVELLYVEASNVNNEYIQLDWATATEINNDGFEVQRSVDGVNFEAIAWVEGKGNSTVVNEYVYEDRSVAKGITYYYQLKQIDYDGEFEYFDIVSARLEGRNDFNIGNIVPNPSKENTTVSVAVQSTSEELMTIQIFNHVGIQVASITKPISSGVNNLEIEIRDLAAGTYFMNFEGTFGMETRKLVIIK